MYPQLVCTTCAFIPQIWNFVAVFVAEGTLLRASSKLADIVATLNVLTVTAYVSLQYDNECEITHVMRLRGRKSHGELFISAYRRTGQQCERCRMHKYKSRKELLLSILAFSFQSLLLF